MTQRSLTPASCLREQRVWPQCTHSPGKVLGRETRGFLPSFSPWQQLTYNDHLVWVYKTVVKPNTFIYTPCRGSWEGIGGSDQDHPQEKEMQKGKKFVWGGLTSSRENMRGEKLRREGKIYPHKCRAPTNSKERWESLPQGSVQRNRKTIEWERLEISSRRLEIPGGYFLQRWARKRTEIVWT